MTRVRLLAAFLLLLTAACSADPPVEPSRAARTPQASIAQETGPGKYTRVLDPCALLTAEQAEQLVPFARAAYRWPACIWRPPALSLPAASVYELVVSFHLAADIAQARAYLKDPPADPWWNPEGTNTPGPATNSFPKVGDESVVYRLESSSTVLGFRLSNAVIMLKYGRFLQGAPDHDPRQRDDARQAALWVAEAVTRPAPAVADPSDGRFAAAPYACSLVEDGEPVSATSCDHGDVTVRHAPAWNGKSGIAVAEAMFAHYRSKPFTVVKGLGDEAFRKKDTLWVRVSNLVVTVEGTKADAAAVIDRLPP